MATRLRFATAIGLIVGLSLIGCGKSGDGNGSSGERSWSRPVMLSAPGSGSRFANVAVGTGGDAVAVYLRPSPPFEVTVNRFERGRGWGTAEQLRASVTRGARGFLPPHATMLPSSEAIFATVELTAFGNPMEQVRTIFDPPGGPRSDHLTGGQLVGVPRVDFDASRNGLVAYPIGGSGLLARVFVTIFENGVFERHEAVSTLHTRVRSTPALGVSEGRDALVAWSQEVGSGVSLFASVSSDFVAGDFTTELVDTLSPPALDPSVAVDDAGVGFVVWAQSTLQGVEPQGIYALRRNLADPTSSWGTPVRIDANPGGDAIEPRVAVDEVGNAIAVWRQFNGADLRIWANRYVAGAGWGAAIRIDDFNGQVGNAAIAATGDGRAIAVWSQQDETGRLGIRSASFDPEATGSGWSAPIDVENDAGATAVDPEVAMDADGHAVVVWELRDLANPDRSGIWASRYR